MRISQKLDYANRAVLQLAKCYDGKSVCKSEEISSKEEIPAAFLIQILTELKKAGIIISKRGKAGGYLLGKPPRNISFADVIRAVEPHLLEDAHEFQGESGKQLMRHWEKLSSTFKSRAEEMNFEDLLVHEEPMWFI